MKFTSGKRLLTAINDYIENCRADSDPKRPIFANVAGFCRYAGIPVSQFLGLKRKFPAEYEIAGAYFEDAALNSGATASLVSLYLKQYGFWGDQSSGDSDVECEHDIFTDGV